MADPGAPPPMSPQQIMRARYKQQMMPPRTWKQQEARREQLEAASKARESQSQSAYTAAASLATRRARQRPSARAAQPAASPQTMASPQAMASPQTTAPAAGTPVRLRGYSIERPPNHAPSFAADSPPSRTSSISSSSSQSTSAGLSSSLNSGLPSGRSSAQAASSAHNASPSTQFRPPLSRRGSSTSSVSLAAAQAVQTSSPRGSTARRLSTSSMSSLMSQKQLPPPAPPPEPKSKPSSAKAPKSKVLQSSLNTSPMTVRTAGAPPSLSQGPRSLPRAVPRSPRQANAAARASASRPIAVAPREPLSAKFVSSLTQALRQRTDTAERQAQADQDAQAASVPALTKAAQSSVAHAGHSNAEIDAAQKAENTHSTQQASALASALASTQSRSSFESVRSSGSGQSTRTPDYTVPVDSFLELMQQQQAQQQQQQEKRRRTAEENKAKALQAAVAAGERAEENMANIHIQVNDAVRSAQERRNRRELLRKYRPAASWTTRRVFKPPLRRLQTSDSAVTSEGQTPVSEGGSAYFDRSVPIPVPRPGPLAAFGLPGSWSSHSVAQHSGSHGSYTGAKGSQPLSGSQGGSQGSPQTGIMGPSGSQAAPLPPSQLPFISTHSSTVGGPGLGGPYYGGPIAPVTSGSSGGSGGASSVAASPAVSTTAATSPAVSSPAVSSPSVVSPSVATPTTPRQLGRMPFTLRSKPRTSKRPIPAPAPPLSSSPSSSVSNASITSMERNSGFYTHTAPSSSSTTIPQPQAPPGTTQAAQARMPMTLRGDARRRFNEDKPWKGHREVSYMSARERKRYEPLWAANRDWHLPYLYVPSRYQKDWEDALQRIHPELFRGQNSDASSTKSGQSSKSAAGSTAAPVAGADPAAVAAATSAGHIVFPEISPIQSSSTDASTEFFDAADPDQGVAEPVVPESPYAEPVIREPSEYETAAEVPVLAEYLPEDGADLVSVTDSVPESVPESIAGVEVEADFVDVDREVRKRSDEVHGYLVARLWRRSRLPEETLAQIWDLVDTNKDGTLERSGFVVGMWLCDQCLYGRKLPARVPPEVWQSVGKLNLKIRVKPKRSKIGYVRKLPNFFGSALGHTMHGSRKAVKKAVQTATSHTPNQQRAFEGNR